MNYPGERENKLETVVYICGSGRSGSTLLDILLNKSDDVSSLGEIHRLGYYLVNDGVCGCGLQFKVCEFWKNVLTELGSSSNKNDLAAMESEKCIMMSDLKSSLFSEYLERALLVLSNPRLFKFLAPKLFNHNHASILRSFALYNAVALAADTAVVIDSTKDARRLKYLYLYNPKSVKIIYLVRDGRAVAQSAIKREQVDMRHAADSWKLKHKKIGAVLKNIPDGCIYKIKYEDLCTNPATEIDKIFSFIGAQGPSNIEDVDKGNYHGLGGNPMRFRRDEVAITLDEKWKSELKPGELSTFDSVAGSLNKKLGY